MSQPKSTYSFRLSDKTIKQLQYCGYKLRPKDAVQNNLTADLERSIAYLEQELRKGPKLF